jgi:tetratricopeptide (TPR) repeat protein
MGVTHQFAGEFAQARDHLELALALFKPGRDDDLAYRFGFDVGVAALANLAISTWALGDVERAISLSDSAQARLSETHMGTRAFGNMLAWVFHMMRRDQVRAASNALEVARLAREHDLTTWRAFGLYLESWATAQKGNPEVGLLNMRRGAELLREQNMSMFDGLFKIALAEAECRADLGRAVATVDEALAICESTGQRAFEAELHRVRGEMLLKRHPSNPMPVEEAFHAAIAVAKRQGARSYELRAALSLAMLCQSTGRPSEAHDVLAPALEGFFATPEMPEIAEAQTLLAALAETDEVKAGAARRETRSKLHAGYALATMMTKGFGADETKAALARAASASANSGTPEYWTVTYGRINADMMRGDHSAARAGAEAFLAEAETAGLPGHAAFARRMLGFLKLLAGDVAGARVDLERALADYDERRDESLRTVFALEFRSNALAYLGLVAWHLGDFEEAERLTDDAIRRAKDSGQPGSCANALVNRVWIDALCGRAEEVLPVADEIGALAAEHDLKYWRAIASTYADWARVRLGEPRSEAFRAGLAACADLGARIQEAIFSHLIAEVEYAVGRRGETLAAVNRGLALAAETGAGGIRPWLLRLRGDALAGTDPAGTASAYRDALSVAGAQGSRALALMAALALAKLLQSTGEAKEAHAILSDALEGFAPTPLFPTIAEAPALLATLAETDEVKAEAARRERRVKLQTAYGRALMWTKGFASEEAKDAFARAREMSDRTDAAAERFSAYNRQFVRSYMRAEWPQARATAEAFLRDADDGGYATEAYAARRCLGAACLFQGDLREARALLEQAVADYARDGDALTRFRFGVDGGVLAASFLALAMWRLGEVVRARQLGRTGLPARGRVGPRPDQRSHVCFRSASRHRTRRTCRRASLGGDGACAWSRARNGPLCCLWQSLRWLGARSAS